MGVRAVVFAHFKLEGSLRGPCGTLVPRLCRRGRSCFRDEGDWSQGMLLIQSESVLFCFRNGWYSIPVEAHAWIFNDLCVWLCVCALIVACWHWRAVCLWCWAFSLIQVSSGKTGSPGFMISVMFCYWFDFDCKNMQESSASSSSDEVRIKNIDWWWNGLLMVVSCFQSIESRRKMRCEPFKFRTSSSIFAQGVKPSKQYDISRTARKMMPLAVPSGSCVGEATALVGETFVWGSVCWSPT